MGATANLASELQVITSGLDSVVIRRYGAGIIGGRTLDVSGYPYGADAGLSTLANPPAASGKSSGKQDEVISDAEIKALADTF